MSGKLSPRPALGRVTGLRLGGCNGQIDQSQSSQPQAEAEDWQDAAETAEAGKENQADGTRPRMTAFDPKRTFGGRDYRKVALMCGFRSRSVLRIRSAGGCVASGKRHGNRFQPTKRQSESAYARRAEGGSKCAVAYG